MKTVKNDKPINNKPKTSQAKKPKKKKKGSKGMKIAAIIVFILGVIAAAILIWYYQKAKEHEGKFLDKTYINGVDVSGLTPDEVEEKIRASVEVYDLTVTFRDGKSYTISGEDMDYHYVSDHGTQEILDSQDTWTWFFRQYGEDEKHVVSEATTYDPDMLREAVKALPEFSEENVTEPTDAYVYLKDYTFSIEPETEGNSPIADQVAELAVQTVDQREQVLDVSENDACYNHPSVYQNDENLTTQVQQLNDFLSTVFIYILPDNNTQTIDKTVLTGWLKEEDGQYYIDEDLLHEKVNDYVTNLASLVDYVRSTEDFVMTSGEVIEYPSNEYGLIIDQDQEKAALYANIANHVSETREPIYSRRDEAPAKNMGGTYVEVDLTNQHCYYYENNELLWDSPCVTGTRLSNMTEEAAEYIYPDLTDIDLENTFATPTGVYFIFEKKKNFTLNGPETEDGEREWESFVKYWMPFNKTVGFHDASWRGESDFGGDTYIDYGSHGCVNLPVDKAGELYKLVKVGTIVVVNW